MILAVNAALVVLTSALVLRDFPNSADEYSYFVSAELLARGELSVPSPEPRRFFDFIHIVNDGRYYGKYPPGWPALLAAGMAVGAPWLVNLILGTAAAAATYMVARRFISLEVANLATIITLANPFFVFNAASYFSHVAGLFFITLFLGAMLSWVEEPSRRLPAVLAGTAAGVAFVIRPYTMVLVGVPTLVYAAHRAWKDGRLSSFGRAVLLAAGPSLVFLGLYHWYNFAQTGDPWVSPFQVYAPGDRVSWPTTIQDLKWRLRNHLGLRLVDLALWLPLSPLLLVLYVIRPSARAGRHALIFVALPVCLVLGHLLYRGTGGNQYGPRYVFEGFSCLVLVGACVIRSCSRAGPILLSAILAMNAGMVVRSARLYSDQVEERMEVYDRAREGGLVDAIVFLRTGSGTMPPGDLTRNGIDFNGPVLYVHDLGAEKNEALLRRYPGRTPYVYEYDPREKAGRLSPYSMDD